MNFARGSGVDIEILVARVYGSGNPYPFPTQPRPREGCSPKRLSSKKNTILSGAERKSLTSSWFFFKRFLGLFIRLGMVWPWRLLPKSQVAHQVPGGGFTQGDTELRLYCQHQFRQGPKNGFSLTIAAFFEPAGNLLPLFCTYRGCPK